MYTERDSTGRMKLLLEAWRGAFLKGGEKERQKKENKSRKKENDAHDSKLVSKRQCVYSPPRLGVRQRVLLDGWNF